MARLIGTIIVGFFICLAWAVDMWCGTSYLRNIRDAEKRLNNLDTEFNEIY